MEIDYLLNFFKHSSAEFATVFIVILTILLSTSLTLRKINLNMLNDKKNRTIKNKELNKLKNDLIKSINLRQYSTNSKNEDNSDDLETTIVEKNLIYMNTNMRELYDKRYFDNNLKKISFILAVVMSIVGTAILFIGLVICLFTTEKIGWITTASGAIVEIVASIYFWLVNRTMKEVKENSKQLEKNEDLITAIELIEKIDDVKVKNETYKNVVEKLIAKK